MVGLLRAARDHKDLPRTVLLLMDSGGVRLQEANAGELAVAELMRAIVERSGLVVRSDTPPSEWAARLGTKPPQGRVARISRDGSSRNE